MGTPEAGKTSIPVLPDLRAEQPGGGKQQQEEEVPPAGCLMGEPLTADQIDALEKWAREHGGVVSKIPWGKF